MWIWSSGTIFNEMLIKIYTFSLKKIHLKMSSAKWRPICLGLNVSNIPGRQQCWVAGWDPCCHHVPWRSHRWSVSWWPTSSGMRSTSHVSRDLRRRCRTSWRSSVPDDGTWQPVYRREGLAQDCSNSSALAMELLQSCAKPSMYYTNGSAKDCSNSRYFSNGVTAILHKVINVLYQWFSV